MKLFKIDLVSKNNQQRGSYFYMPIVNIDGKYFRCRCIKSDGVINKNNVDLSAIEITSEILPQYYAANGIK